MAEADTPALSVEESIPNGPKHVKDKKCPWCGQPFTSSSLGRHLDLYVRPNNPKQPDGIHDVAAIKRLRGTITRRRTRGVPRRRDPSASAAGSATPGGPSGDGFSPAPSDAVQSPAQGGFNVFDANPKPTAHTRGTVNAFYGRNFPFKTPWEVTGVMNEDERQALPDGPRSMTSGQAPQTPLLGQQPLHSQQDPRQMIQDAQDTARAAELALREMVCSWRAAKLHLDVHSMPFDFDPLTLDFPALVLQCLQPPPTIFSSTFYPTPTSWSLQPPGWDQFKALENYFQEEFKTWRIKCKSATTAVNEDLSYPPAVNFVKVDIKEAIRRSETINKSLEKNVAEHLKKAFGVWEAMSQFDREKMWQLELARSVARKQKEINTMKEEQHRIRQENNNLKQQIEHLNMLQQPREYKLQTPITIPIEKKLIDYMSELMVVHNVSGVGMEPRHRHEDLNTICQEAIDRWKKVVQSGRHAPQPPASAPPPAQPQGQQPEPQPQQQPQRQQRKPRKQQQQGPQVNGPPSPQSQPAPPPPPPPTPPQPQPTVQQNGSMHNLPQHLPQPSPQQPVYQPVTEPQFPQAAAVLSGGPATPHNPIASYYSAVAADFAARNSSTSSNVAPQQAHVISDDEDEEDDGEEDGESDEGDDVEDGEDDEDDGEGEGEGESEDAEMAGTEEVQQPKGQPQPQNGGSSGAAGGGSNGAGEPMNTD